MGYGKRIWAKYAAK
ncbi:hypothetical protein [[Clostridium] symbiosum]